MDKRHKITLKIVVTCSNLGIHKDDSAKNEPDNSVAKDAASPHTDETTAATDSQEPKKQPDAEIMEVDNCEEKPAEVESMETEEAEKEIEEAPKSPVNLSSNP